MSSENQSRCRANWVDGVIVRDAFKGDWLLVFAAFLDAPGNLDSFFCIGRVFGELSNELVIHVIKKEVVSNKGFYDFLARGVDMIINFITLGLGVFTYARAYVST
jgi:hypothetical protein